MTVDDAATARPDLKRRAFLGAVGTTAAGLAASTPAAAQEGSSGSGSGSGNGGTTDGTIEKAWFEGVSNCDGVVDETGKETVTVAVGARGNGGNFAFEPAALRVDPGTTVRWEWTGEGGGHNVVSESGAFESEIASDARFTFEHAFEESGATRYVCVPHQSMGMRGAVLVGPDAAVGGSAGESDEGKSSPYGGWLDNTDNFEKVLDRTDQDRVEVLVGAQGNRGSFAFSPLAIEIERGTTVVWRWAEDAGALNLAATDGSFWTDFGREAGETFEWTFTDNEVLKYSSPSYEALGMKGLIVVGDPNAPTLGERLSTPGGLAVGGGLAMGLLSPIAFGTFLFATRNTDRPATRTRRRRGRVSPDD